AQHCPRLVGRLAPLENVEQKPGARRAHPSHVMQLATQCVLGQEVYGRRPPYGLLVLADVVQQQVLFTPALERRVLETAAAMPEVLLRGADPGPGMGWPDVPSRWLSRDMLGVASPVISVSIGVPA